MSTSKRIEILNLVNNVCHGEVQLKFNFYSSDAKLMLVRLKKEGENFQQDGEKIDCKTRLESELKRVCC